MCLHAIEAIKQKFALEYEPDHYVKVRITNPTTEHKVLVRITGPNFKEPGGGTQFFLTFDTKKGGKHFLQIENWFDKTVKDFPEGGF
jgi:hypothetical protein